MTKQIKRLSVLVFLMFMTLFAASSIIHVVAEPTLTADGRNTRTILDSYSTKRGAIIVGRQAVAQSVAVDNQYRFLRTYNQPELYSAVTGYFTLTQGMTGIESTENEYLSGTSNSQFFEQLSDVITGRTPQGASVTLTINQDAQQAAWDALGDKTGAVVAYEPATGKILAMVSKPGYDPNLLSGHSTSEVIENYNELIEDSTNPLINRAIAGDLYPPGSTFKLVVAAAALENGLTPEYELDNPERLQLVGSTSYIQNVTKRTCGSGDTATIELALRESCNIPFAELGLELGTQVLSEQAARFGFGENIEVPMAVTPSVFPQGDSAQLMLSSFGQWEVRTTPLQVAMISGAIANGGVSMQPQLVDQIRNRDLQVLQSYEPEELSQAVSAETAKTLTEMMTDGVDNGAASGARIDGVKVAGKTGTAENGEGMNNTVWFTGFAPSDNPQVAIAVVVEDSDESGNAVAAPIAREVMKAVLAE